jgi:polysaccharide pyruvyl transferase WcaK-like protein
VPGMGVLEGGLPLKWWDLPYAMFLLSLTGRLSRTKVALVSVGASPIKRRLTRRLLDWSAQLAFYRSYRDAFSRDSMGRRGLDVTGDPVYPDLAFSIPVPPPDSGDSRVVALGVMDYHGSNDDRRHADEIYAAYIEPLKSFVDWLIDDGRQVRVVIGDTNSSDERAVRDILAHVRAGRPGLDPGQVVALPVSSFSEVMAAIGPAGIVVATRFHNVVCALRLCKPTIALGYGPKFTALMADMGLADFCQSTKSLDVDRLIAQFTDLERRQAQVREILIDRNGAYEQLLSDQFARLSAILFGADRSRQPEAGHQPVPGGVR